MFYSSYNSTPLEEVRRARHRISLPSTDKPFLCGVVAYRDLIDCGSYNAAKEKGLVRSEGKEYVMEDGDVVLFRFNV